MGGVVRTVCSVAEIESTAETACENCLGTELAQYTENGESSDSYFAPVFLEGGGLESWRFDDQPTQGAPAEYPAKMIEILYPPGGFTHLCIKYNREGGARINVVAVNKETGERIRPKTLPANGLDKLCPILSATMDGAPLDPAVFQWSDAALTDLLNPVPGGWTTEPPSTPGDLALTARARRSIPTARACCCSRAGSITGCRNGWSARSTSGPARAPPTASTRTPMPA